jgi:hypothetical protein
VSVAAADGNGDGLNRDGREPELVEERACALVAGVGLLAEAAVQLDERAQVLRMRETASAGAGAEATGNLARDAPEEDVLVLAGALALRLLAEEEHVAVRPGERRRRERDLEGLVAAHGAKIAQIADALNVSRCR